MIFGLVWGPVLVHLGILMSALVRRGLSRIDVFGFISKETSDRG
jgi:hypothetical protein